VFRLFLSCLFVVLYSGHQIGAYFEIHTRSLPKSKQVGAHKNNSNYNWLGLRQKIKKYSLSLWARRIINLKRLYLAGDDSGGQQSWGTESTNSIVIQSFLVHLFYI
jgi:hypothetical protein